MSRIVRYDPPDKPVVGGYAATMSGPARSFGRSLIVAATQRVIKAGPYHPTGDVAFDTRAQALRQELLKGNPSAFKESNLSFTTAGL
jgi:hypothetical protein